MSRETLRRLSPPFGASSLTQAAQTTSSPCSWLHTSSRATPPDPVNLHPRPRHHLLWEVLHKDPSAHPRLLSTRLLLGQAHRTSFHLFIYSNQPLLWELLG